MEEFFLYLVSKYPVLVGVLMAIGAARVVFKAVFSAAKLVVQATPTPKDDKILDDIEVSQTYKFIMFVVDYFLSIKLPGAKL